MRYKGQGYEVRVPFEKQHIDADTLDELRAAFEDTYKQFYGRLSDGVPIEAVNWRVTISGPKTEIGRLALEGDTDQNDDAPYTTRPARFAADSDAQDTPIYRRNALSVGFSAPGPAIIEESASTTIVLPGWSFRVDE